MIPIKDDNPTERYPLVTITLIALNALVFLLQNPFNKARFSYLVFAYGARPFEINNLIDIEPYGLLPVPLTILSSMFMHGDFLHLGGNMLYLWIFGNNIEDHMGRLKFTLFYFVSNFKSGYSQ